jgi:hypothetical protein
MRSHRATTAVSGLVLVGALTACGTTVPLAQQGAAESSSLVSGDGLSPVVPGALTPNPPRAVAPTSRTTSLPRAVATSPVGTAATPVTGPVLRSDEPVRVGVLYLTGVDTVSGALGISGLSTGDTKAQAAAAFGWVAGHGHLGGHPAKVFYYGIAAQDSVNNAQAAQQAACAALTQDDKVRYVVSILPLLPGTMACFAHAGVGVVDDASALSDKAMAQYSESFVAPGDFAAGRMITLLVDDLWRRGWLTASSKVGSFAYDNPENLALVDGALTDALRAHGLTITSKQAVSNDASAVSGANNASLQYRAAGVDRIIPVLASPLFLMNAASSQHYNPAYAMYSLFGPGALLEGTAPKDQLVNSAGIGWQPYLDIGAGTHPGPVSSNETLCFALMKAAGQASSSSTTKGFQVQVCNAVLYLKAAFDALPSAPGNLLSASRALIGARFQPADTFRTDVSRRPDGAAGYRALAYETGCSCYQYVGGVRTTP